MTVGRLLVEAKARLADSDTPYLDASLILANRLGVSRETLLARLSEECEAPRGFEEDLARRALGESVAYILGRKEFFGREFRVDGRVLVPRPDTEILVEAALECGSTLSPSGSLRVHDLCTGSGAVALSIAAEKPGWSVSASDISADALAVACANSVALLGREIPLLQSDLCEGLEGPFDLITANPPYVSGAETGVLLAKGWREPELALDGGVDGLDIVRRLVPGALRVLAPGGILLIEADGSQAETIHAMLENVGYESIRAWKDLAGFARVTGGSRPWTTS